jgi:hypothetical protein
MNAQQLKKAHADAVIYAGKIGRAQRHYSSGIFGRLSKLVVQTEVNHQENPSDTNYWEDKNFDEALTSVIRNNFADLAKKTIELMALQYTTSRIAEKEGLIAQLAEIEALENEAAA